MGKSNGVVGVLIYDFLLNSIKVSSDNHMSVSVPVAVIGT